MLAANRIRIIQHLGVLRVGPPVRFVNGLWSSLHARSLSSKDDTVRLRLT
jgi:hypothetical protein